MDFPTQSDYFRIFRDEILAGNGKITRDAVERDGTDINIIGAATAALADEVTGQLADVESGLFLDSARGQKLDRLVFDRYGLVRKPASAALGSVQFSTVASNPTPFTIPINTICQTADGVQYITTAAAIFPAGTTGPVVVGVRSALAGLDQTAKALTITSIVTAITGQPTDLTVTNTLATSGADDEEKDTNLRERARRFFVTVRRGTLAAIEAAATAVPGVRRAAAFEVYDTLGRPARFVQLVIADPFTDALVKLDANPPTYQLQSQQLSLTVFNSLSDVRSAGMFVQVFVAQTVLLPVSLNLKFTAGSNIDLVATIARATVGAYINSLKPGQAFAVVEAQAFLRNVPGLFYTGTEVVDPVGDVVPKALQVIRTSFNLITAQAVQGDTPVALTATANPDAFIVRGLLGA